MGSLSKAEVGLGQTQRTALQENPSSNQNFLLIKLPIHALLIALNLQPANQKKQKIPQQ